MNIRKLSKEIYDECHAYRGAGGKILVSRNDVGGYDVYHVDGNSWQGYPGDNAQSAQDRVIYTIDLRDIDWNARLKGWIEDELRRIKKEELDNAAS